MTSIQKFDSEALILGTRDQFSIVVIDVEILTSIDQGKVLCALNDSVNAILDIENLR